MGHRVVVQADKAELSSQILLWRECQCHQDTDLGNVDRQPAAHDNAEEAHTLLELFGVGHNGQDNTDVLCGFLQPL